jgi:hypothetical protein
VGIPHDSIIAISTYGCIKTEDDKYHFEAGLEACMQALTPKIVLVHGAMAEKIFGMAKGDKKGVPLPFFTQLFVYYIMTGTGSEYPLASQVRLEKPTFCYIPNKIGCSYIAKVGFFAFIGVKMAKKTEKTDNSVPNPLVESGVEKMIRIVRGKQVLLDRDLAALYGVETKRINEQVKRNIERFPEDFCIQLSLEESQLLRSQNATLEKKGQNLKGKHTKYRSLAFTEQGVAMLSSVLKSESAIKVNIAIMRAFVQLRHLMMGNGGLVNRLSNVEAKDLEQDCRLIGHDEHLLDHDRKFDELFEAMDRGELKSKGLFYNNQEFDAYVFVCNLIRQAKKRIVLVDRYVNEKTLTMMLKREKGVSVTIYTYDKSKVLELDLATYNEQYPDSPMQVLPSYGMHDRFLFIDDTAYHFGASLKDLGKNTFFFTQEDFTLDEVLKKSKKMRK